MINRPWRCDCMVFPVMKQFSVFSTRFTKPIPLRMHPKVSNGSSLFCCMNNLSFQRDEGYCCLWIRLRNGSSSTPCTTCLEKVMFLSIFGLRGPFHSVKAFDIVRYFAMASLMLRYNTSVFLTTKSVGGFS